jgi:hypothetical protein
MAARAGKASRRVSVLAALPPERPPLSALPIPRDAGVSWCWSNSLREMADHLGAYAVLQLVDRFGGLTLYIPTSAANWHVADLIGADAAAILCAIYGREQLDLPVGTAELFAARAAPILAGVRAKTLSYTEAAWLLHTSRKYISFLVNQTTRFADPTPFVHTPRVDPRQLFMFSEEDAE